MNTKVLVTGANGQLGKTLADVVAKNEDTIEFTFVSKSELDITNKSNVQDFFSKHNYAYCINCAAYTNVEQAEQTPEIAFEVNAEAVKNIAESCRETDTILIHISTDYVFDGEKSTPYTVDDLPNPINEYGKSKFLGEQYVQEILQEYFIIRTSWLFSKTYGHNFYRTILNKSKTEETLSIADTETGCPTNTINLANYILDLIEKQSVRYGIKHFSDSKAMTWYDFAELILSENDYSDKINLVKAKKYLTFAARPKNSVLSNFY